MKKQTNKNRIEKIIAALKVTGFGSADFYVPVINDIGSCTLKSAISKSKETLNNFPVYYVAYPNTAEIFFSERQEYFCSPDFNGEYVHFALIKTAINGWELGVNVGCGAHSAVIWFKFLTGEILEALPDNGVSNNFWGDENPEFPSFGDTISNRQWKIRKKNYTKILKEAQTF